MSTSAPVELPPINLALDGPRTWQALAAQPDPAAALVSLVHRACSDVAAQAGTAGWNAGHAAAIREVASEPAILRMMSAARAEGRQAGERTLSLDDKSTHALAAALAGAVAAAPAPAVHVAAPAVHFHAPDPKPRRQIAVEQEDGSVVLEDLPA